MASAAAATNGLKVALLRPALQRAPRIQPILLVASSAAAPLSTTASLAAAPSGPKSRQDIVKSPKKTFNKKRLGVESVRKPAPGERKAFRKRITLSSNSALAVEGLQVLGSGVLADARSAGTVVELPDQVVDQLRALGAFRPGQSWGLFRKPHVLVRKETVDMVARMDKAVSDKTAARIVLTGSRASGKSTALVQAMSHALKNDWVVINIPEAQDLVIAHTDYVPVPDTVPMQFTQPTYTLNLLQNILKANKAVLEKVKIEQKSSLTAGLSEGSSLADLIVNIREPDAAWPGFLALWSELMLPGRPPVFMAMDGLTFANKDTQYRDPAFNKVHAHDLTLIGHFFAALSGTTPMPNGGAVIAADSASNTPARHPSEALVLGQLEAGQAGREVPVPDPYLRGYDDRVYDALKNCHVMRLEGVSHDEARALMEYWGASGLVRGVLSTELVAQKWALGGHGNIGEMERVVLQNLKM
ncbi:Ribosomal protein S23/S29, mitochondrial [Cordyceps fumosorosea ARSEF 2679]|uniref:Small ribosomal subunit protein mS29 n=1 Tax=Cordyceps fumosorosea (strain ARSEF 2679) TaxID=1081104 RepID=A0A162LEL7_CORFA|nr:Ribosomal protein S23/S29, mitochondrial [Cordyceps fumosorosea ARSEF 2679]OAA69554.1 Ribosomal protein S23/S29, mitochondrial [Cordyceps fumosorosea ARSEF 2679]